MLNPETVYQEYKNQTLSLQEAFIKAYLNECLYRFSEDTCLSMVEIYYKNDIDLTCRTRKQAEQIIENLLPYQSLELQCKLYGQDE